MTDAPSIPARVIFVGGGTGGTVGPGIAIAERLLDLEPALKVLFICSDRSVDRRLLDPGGWSCVPTSARSPGVRPLPAFRFARGWIETRRQVRDILADPIRSRVVALGGYVAPPAVREAVHRGVPVDLLNLDRVAGRANQWIAKRADRILTAVPTNLPGSLPPVGVPLRRSVLPEGSPESSRVSLGLKPDRPTLLITGASQGAASIDRFLLDLIPRHVEWFDGWQVLHLASDDSVPPLEIEYSTSGIHAVVLPFLDRMGAAWAAADLAITRGGASSLAEVSASRTPSIVLPYPWHEDEHQLQNAAELEKSGAVVIRRDPAKGVAALTALESRLAILLRSADERARMKASFPPSGEDAAEVLARMILQPAPATN
jgi:UDP-N-acetylglucosamine--N-acetylmuramyl-(pentapeptide) pyrophosphoryl-undecaprenol N-acetylglucosamine transferase